MKRDFAKELKSFIKAIDANHIVRGVPSLYNIHKRTLPVGYDRVVFFGLTYDNAKQVRELFLKSRVDGDIVIYFDIVDMDATDKERSVYFNPKDFFIKEDIQPV